MNADFPLHRWRQVHQELLRDLADERRGPRRADQAAAALSGPVSGDLPGRTRTPTRRTAAVREISSRGTGLVSGGWLGFALPVGQVAVGGLDVGVVGAEDAEAVVQQGLEGGRCDCWVSCFAGPVGELGSAGESVGPDAGQGDLRRLPACP